MLRGIEVRVLAATLAGLLAWSWPGARLHAAPAEPAIDGEGALQPGEFAPVEITPVELPPPEPEPEPEPDIDTDIDTDVDTDADAEDLEPIDDDYDPTRDSAAARDARRWTRAGIASTVTGTVLVAGATALGLSDPCDPSAGNNCFHDARDRAALTMGVPGAVMLLGGIAMIIVGSVQKRRLRADLALSRDHVGVAISGRF